MENTRWFTKSSFLKSVRNVVEMRFTPSYSVRKLCNGLFLTSVVWICVLAVVRRLVERTPTEAALTDDLYDKVRSTSRYSVSPELTRYGVSSTRGERSGVSEEGLRRFGWNLSNMSEIGSRRLTFIFCRTCGSIVSSGSCRRPLFLKFRAAKLFMFGVIDRITCNSVNKSKIWERRIAACCPDQGESN